eukprot:NODE_3966_length_711_cov_36.981873_g3351_i0.p1 GENE.NODE_3966_length_711_cov_36.981873_g3351_i0~~NODE_3966_length_711_cov_36.981873_g3351_i0.p1  ORF type:complete len:189 (-),score=38.19 NODE_3966_length_711_cov_36.981873_g3351_i0:115-681(-)
MGTHSRTLNASRQDYQLGPPDYRHITAVHLHGKGVYQWYERQSPSGGTCRRFDVLPDLQADLSESRPWDEDTLFAERAHFSTYVCTALHGWLHGWQWEYLRGRNGTEVAMWATAYFSTDEPPSLRLLDRHLTLDTPARQAGHLLYWLTDLRTSPLPATMFVAPSPAPPRPDFLPPGHSTDRACVAAKP